MSQRSNIVMQRLTTRVIDLYNERMLDIEAIADLLKSEGFKVSKSGVQRFLASAKDLAEEQREIYDEIAFLAEKARDNPNTDLIETATTLMSVRLYKAIRNLPDIDNLDPEALAAMLHKLGLTQVRVARLRLEHVKGFEAAREAIMAEFARELSADPDLLDRFRSIAARVKPPEV